MGALVHFCDCQVVSETKCGILLEKCEWRPVITVSYLHSILWGPALPPLNQPKCVCVSVFFVNVHQLSGSDYLEKGFEFVLLLENEFLLKIKMTQYNLTARSLQASTPTVLQLEVF